MALIEGFRVLPVIVVMLGFADVIIGAMSLTLAKFGDTVDTCWNSSYSLNTTTNSHCDNNTLQSAVPIGPDGTNLSYEYYSILEGLNSQEELAQQQSTLAIIAIMAIIILVIGGVITYVTVFKKM